MFKVDENLPQAVVDLLRTAGFDAMSVHDQDMVGETDPNIAAVCKSEGRIIITLDTDFGDIRVYPPEEYPGIVVLRLQRHDKPHVLNVTQRVIRAFSVELPVNQLWIVDEERIRIRG